MFNIGPQVGPPTKNLNVGKLRILKEQKWGPDHPEIIFGGSWANCSSGTSCQKRNVEWRPFKLVALFTFSYQVRLVGGWCGVGIIFPSLDLVIELVLLDLVIELFLLKALEDNRPNGCLPPCNWEAYQAYLKQLIRISSTIKSTTSSQAPSYASLKLRPSHLLTGVKCGTTSVAKNADEYGIMWQHTGCFF